MEDLRAIARIIIRHRRKVLVLLAIGGGLVFLAGGARLEFVSVGPDGTYRLEYFSARRYQRLLHWDRESPSFVRLYRNFDNEYYGESDVADFFGGNGRSTLIHEAGEVAGRPHRRNAVMAVSESSSGGYSHQQYLAKKPDGYWRLGGCGVTLDV